MRALRLAPALILLLLLMPAPALAQWPAWETFAQRFIQSDGRVIDLTFDQKSTSEGQSYGLFFALVANDRERFQRILDWTSHHLAGRKLGSRLPAWLWGRHGSGSWGVLDQNAASDGDLWIAYSLLEAARLWNQPAYADIARKLLRQVKAREVVSAGKAGPLLLPGPYGFELEGGRYRVDPSYLPPFMLRYFETVDGKGPWWEIWEAHMRAAPQIYSRGLAPDLFVVDRRGRVSPDTERPWGGYDAIRVYLWAAMSGADGAALLDRLRPYAELVRAHGGPPEKVDTQTGAVLNKDYLPPGFSGALLPYLSALGEQKLLDQQLARLPQRLSRPTNYYDEALILFGAGWLEGFYRFDAQGRVLPRWQDQEKKIPENAGKK